MAKLRISNQFGKLLQRVDFTGTNYLIEPPLVVAIDGMEAWESNDSGSVTYGIYEQYGQPTPDQVFTLVWEFLPTGERHFTTEEVDAGITITTEETVDETIYYIKVAQNRLHLPARPPRPPHAQRPKQAPPSQQPAFQPPPPPPPPVQPPTPSYQAPPQQAAYPPPPAGYPPPAQQPAFQPPPPVYRPPPPPPAFRPSPVPGGRIAIIIPLVIITLLICSLGAVLAARYQPHPGNSMAVNPTTPPTTAPTMTPIPPTITPTITPTVMPTPIPLQATMVIRTNTTDVQSSQTGEATASCQSGEQMVGGGFDFTYALTPGNTAPTAIESNYPKDLNDWTAVVNNQDYHSRTLTVYADCVNANFSLGMQLVPTVADTIQHTGGTLLATCPTGTVLTGGGASSDPSSIPGTYTPFFPGLVNSYPENNDWHTWFDTDPTIAAQFLIQGFALCATKNYQHVGFSSQPLSIGPVMYSGSTPAIIDSSMSVACSAGQLLTSGGFYDATVTAHNSSPIYNVSSHPDPTNTQNWDFTGANGTAQSHDMTVFADCLSY